MSAKAFILVIFISIGLLIFANFLYSQEETIEFEIVDFDTLNGYPGFVQVMTTNDSLNETDFLFEENGYIRMYAYKIAWQDTFYILPDSTYLVKTDSLEIGNTWNAWTGGPANAIVVDTATVSVPAGTFFSYIVEYHPQSVPDSVEATMWFSFDIGMVKVVYGDTWALYDYSLSGGTGYYPVYVGNWWRFGTDTSVDPTFTPIPYSFNLQQNYPNPFNPITTIEYNLHIPANVEMSIYNMKGQIVKRLVNEYKPVGHHSVKWNADGVSSGVYFYHIKVDEYSSAKKCIILK